jgi:RimJ/RimL family protein N-acetyltransferase
MTTSPLPARLETARLRLRPLGPSDVDVVHRLWAERDPRHPARRRVDDEGRPSRDEVRDRLTVQAEESVRTGVGLLHGRAPDDEAARGTGRARLWSTVRRWNSASIRVLEKAGFTDSGRVTPDPEDGDTVWMTCDLLHPSAAVA